MLVLFGYLMDSYAVSPMNWISVPFCSFILLSLRSDKNARFSCETLFCNDRKATY